MSGEILERGVLRAMGRPGKPHRFAAQRALRGLDAFNGNLGGVGCTKRAVSKPGPRRR